MKRETVYSSEYATMWYYPDKKIVHHEIHKFIYGKPFQEFFMTGTALVKKHGARKWLSDDRHSPVLRQEDMEWGMTNWLPQTVQAGWKYWAIIQPTSAVGQMGTKESVEMFSKAGIIAKYFTSEEEAMQWLESQN